MPPSLSARTPVPLDGPVASDPLLGSSASVATPEALTDDPDQSPRVPVSNDTIAVYCRIRPTKSPSFNLCDLDKNAGTVEIRVPHNDSGYLNNIRETFEFKFNGIFDHTATQEEVFNGIARPVVENALAGINGTIFAYGQTGSGKTYSITGGTDNYEHRGIIPRTLAMIFDSLQKRTDVRGQVSISYLEIYNQNGYDLLDPSHDSNKLEDLPRVSVIHDDSGNVHLKNLCDMPCASLDEALGLLFVGDTNRIICETPSNDASSRSHCIFTIHLEMKQTSGSKIIRSKIHLVDLAGSERVKKTDVKGKILTEARYINLSLHYLEQVIVALQQRAQGKKTHIPYRNSLLTSVLKDSLGGNCRTAMLATFSLESNHLDETVTTGRFAQRVAMIRNAAYVNEEIDPKLLIQRLKGQVRELREEVMALRGKEVLMSGLTGEDKERCQVLVQQFVSGISGSETSGDGGHSGGKYILKGVRDDIDAENDAKAALALRPIWNHRYKLGYCFELLRHMLVSAASGLGEGAGGVGLVGSGATSGEGTSAGTGIGINIGMAQREQEGYQQEIKRLKLLLQRKEQEIAVLVGVTNGETGCAGNAVADAVADAVARGAPVPKLSLIKGMTERVAAVKGEDAEAATEAVDRVMAFELFRQTYEHNGNIEDNKALLKGRIATAKATGERINGTRAHISTLKSRVEKLRLTRGLENIDGGGRGGDEEAMEAERQLLQEMEESKRAYKADFELLKGMKADIEGLQHTLEKQRRKMQSDFEKWLANGGRGGGESSREGRVDRNDSPANRNDSPANRNDNPANRNDNPADRNDKREGVKYGRRTPTSSRSARAHSHPYTSVPASTAAAAVPLVPSNTSVSSAPSGSASPGTSTGMNMGIGAEASFIMSSSLGKNNSGVGIPIRNPYQQPLRNSHPSSSSSSSSSSTSSAQGSAPSHTPIPATASASCSAARPTGYDSLFNTPLPAHVAPYTAKTHISTSHTAAPTYTPPSSSSSSSSYPTSSPHHLPSASYAAYPPSSSTASPGYTGAPIVAPARTSAPGAAYSSGSTYARAGNAGVAATSAGTGVGVASQQQPSWQSIMSVVGGNVDSDLASFYRIRDEMMNKKK